MHSFRWAKDLRVPQTSLPREHMLWPLRLFAAAAAADDDDDDDGGGDVCPSFKLFVFKVTWKSFDCSS